MEIKSELKSITKPTQKPYFDVIFGISTFQDHSRSRILQSVHDNVSYNFKDNFKGMKVYSKNSHFATTPHFV